MNEKKLSNFNIAILSAVIVINSIIFSATLFSAEIFAGPIRSYLVSIFTPYYTVIGGIINVLVPLYIAKRNPNLKTQAIAITYGFGVICVVISYFFAYKHMTSSW